MPSESVKKALASKSRSCFACGGMVSKKMAFGGEASAEEGESDNWLDNALSDLHGPEDEEDTPPLEEDDEEITPQQTKANFVMAILKRRRK